MDDFDWWLPQTKLGPSCRRGSHARICIYIRFPYKIAHLHSIAGAPIFYRLEVDGYAIAQSSARVWRRDERALI